jgi:glucokinase
MALLLAADIGGTKTDLALFGDDLSLSAPRHQRRYRNADFPSFDHLLNEYLESCGTEPRFACLALAGVVAGERVRMTNLSWMVDGPALAARFHFEQLCLINDLTALAAAIPSLRAGDIGEVQGGYSYPGEMCALIAPGTGLGEGMLLRDGSTLFARGSEGGHGDFAPTDEEQSALLEFARKEIRPVSYESLIAGPGLSRLYRFCMQYHHIRGDEDVAAAMAGMSDPIPLLLEAALRDKFCPLCRKVVELFLAILGSEAGNLALKLYARGGVYLGGGLLPRIFGKVSFAGFLEAFRAKGAMRELMATIPVQLIMRSDAALFGAGCYGLQRFADGRFANGAGD